MRGVMKCLCFGNRLAERKLLVKKRERMDQAMAFIQSANQVGELGRKAKARKLERNTEKYKSI